MAQFADHQVTKTDTETGLRTLALYRSDEAMPNSPSDASTLSRRSSRSSGSDDPKPLPVKSVLNGTALERTAQVSLLLTNHGASPLPERGESNEPDEGCGLDDNPYSTFACDSDCQDEDYDERDPDVFDEMYKLITKSLAGLLLSPVDASCTRVLNLGTGTGVWAQNFADQYPNIEVTGADRGTIFRNWVPVNCEYVHINLDDMWEWTPKFHLVVGTNLVGSCRKPKAVIEQTYSSLMPGGVCEFQELVWTPCYADNSSDKTEMPELLQAMSDRGQNLDSASEYKHWMKDAGFERVEEKVFYLPTGKWPRENHYKDLGSLVGNVIPRRLRELISRLEILLRHGADEEDLWNETSVQLLCLQATKGMCSTHAYLKLRVTCGRKPVDPAQPDLNNDDSDFTNLHNSTKPDIASPTTHTEYKPLGLSPYQILPTICPKPSKRRSDECPATPPPRKKQRVTGVA
ncbi:Fc.00g082160.m01.CDS01 [Cosmosporella sp. VM-42]